MRVDPSSYTVTAEIPPRHETLRTGSSPGPPEASKVRNDDDVGRCTNADTDEAEAAPPWSSCMTAFRWSRQAHRASSYYVEAT